MTDEEFLCGWMDPRPKGGRPEHGSNEVWWRWGWSYVGPSLPQKKTPVEYAWLPRRLTLNECHLIEARLTDEQRHVYCAIMFQRVCVEARSANLYEMGLGYNRWPMLHADAAAKVAALADTLDLARKVRGAK